MMPRLGYVYPCPSSRSGNPTELRNWYAIWTRSRHEKMVIEALKEKEFETFLPLVETVRQWSDRKKKVLLPLFPGYVFASLHREEFQKVYYTSGVAKILGTNGTPIPIPRQTISDIQRVVTSSLPVDLYPTLPVGSRVVIRNGPLVGMQGTLVQWQNRHCVVVSVDALMSGAAVSIMPDSIRPV